MELFDTYFSFICSLMPNIQEENDILKIANDERTKDTKVTLQPRIERTLLVKCDHGYEIYRNATCS